MMNRLANSSNPYQGEFKKVLCVCSAGLLRSPTAAWVLGQEPFGFNTRAAGLSEEYALVLVDKVLIHWADEIVCMNESQSKDIKAIGTKPNQLVICLGIPDNFSYRDPELIRLITERYNQGFGER